MIRWQPSPGQSEWDSPYHNDPDYELFSSPYFSTGIYTYAKKEKPKESKSKWWKCDYCSGVNLPEERKCEHCNAPRITVNDRQKASVWGVNSNFVVKSHEITWKDKILERFSRLWNGLKSQFL